MVLILLCPCTSARQIKSVNDFVIASEVVAIATVWIGWILCSAMLLIAREEDGRILKLFTQKRSSISPAYKLYQTH